MKVHVRLRETAFQSANFKYSTLDRVLFAQELQRSALAVFQSVVCVVQVYTCVRITCIQYMYESYCMCMLRILKKWR